MLIIRGLTILGKVKIELNWLIMILSILHPENTKTVVSENLKFENQYLPIDLDPILNNLDN